MTTPTFVLASKSRPTAYRFLVNKPLGGWAICTVNDSTGELSIQSDWDTWGYRWNVDHLGQPTLTHFIGTKYSDPSYPDRRHYLADKLTSHDYKMRQRFSPKLTTKELCRLAGEAYGEGRIDKETCRTMVAEIRDIGTDDERDFYDAVCQISGHEKLGVDPWYETYKTEPTSGYLVLRDGILPAIIEACCATVRDRSLSVGATVLALSEEAS